jgi:hypothetical protein
MSPIEKQTPHFTPARLACSCARSGTVGCSERTGCEGLTSYLIFDEVDRVLQLHLFSLQWAVVSGQGQAPKCVAATAPLPNDRHDLLFDTRGHGDLCTPNSNMGAPVDDAFRSSLGTL